MEGDADHQIQILKYRKQTRDTIQMEITTTEALLQPIIATMIMTAVET